MKIVILGAGLAGCATAYYLVNKIGISPSEITIYEKDNHGIGGCARTRLYYNIPYEVGPQILYTDENDIRAVFEKYLINYLPPTEDKEYHPKVSIDGKIDDMHDFPITVANVLKFKNPNKVIFELYKINLEKPDFSNFENYIISRIGLTLYIMDPIIRTLC